MNRFELSCIVNRIEIILRMTESYITSGELDGDPEKLLDAAVIGIEAAIAEVEKATVEIAS